jgi:1-acyl-sn-glycerol-3-phosphate acyltransferase
VFTLVSFACFGLGALVLGGMVLPVIHLLNRDAANARRVSRSAVRQSFRLFIWLMKSTGVLSYEVTGQGCVPPGTLVVANHPSLIDVIFVVAHIDDAYCVVKAELGSNVFTRLIVKTTGYPTSAEPERMIEDCVRLLEAGAVVVMFPEGTRTVPGRAPIFKRGAARVLCRAACPLTPVFLRITPPTLAKGEPWSKVPRDKVRYSMEIGEPVPAALLVDQAASERRNVRSGTDWMRHYFVDKLGASLADEQSPDRRTADGHQDPDRRYART